MFAELKTPLSVFIATPCYGGIITDAYFRSMIATIHSFNEVGIRSTIRTLSGRSRVAHPRNTLVAFFLKTNCTHLAFIDADMEFPPDAIQRLLSHSRDVLAGAYTKKKHEVEWCHSPPIDTPDASGLLEVNCAGTGFMVIRRSVFEHIAREDAVPHIRG
jgi:hypothetical protein